MGADAFNLDALIRSMRDLGKTQLSDQVRRALEGARIGLDPNTVEELINELQSNLAEHIDRLERIAGVLSDDERQYPERMPAPRRQQVAVAAGCDTEEVEELCEAFNRAREILARHGDGEGRIDVRLLFGKLPGLNFGPGEDGLPQVPSQVLEGLLERAARASEVPSQPDELEELFDFKKAAQPKNRLPKDWKP
ncbi:MAG: hypothetical protein IT463_12550 [Planctomycetes bacterium]|nr:hypothetical protein [Planctomycetota bacterium]